MRMTDNTILITGGTSGIGRGLAEALHDRGNCVIVAGRRRDLIADIVSARPDITAVHLDLNDPRSLQDAARLLGERFPTLNVVIANAGISRTEDMTSDTWNISSSVDMI